MLCKCEDLRLGPQHPYKSWTGQHPTVTSVLGGGWGLRTDRSRGGGSWPASLGSLWFRRRICFKHKVEEWLRNIVNTNPWLIYT